MILPDVNVLVYAFRADADEHEVAARWLETTIAATEAIALHDAVLSGFVRIVTHPRIMRDPAPAAAASEFVERLTAAPSTRWLPHSREVWRRFGALCVTDPAIRGNLVPDAFLAALCMTHGVRIATRDRGFARFDGLRWFDPLAPS